MISEDQPDGRWLTAESKDLQDKGCNKKRVLAVVVVVDIAIQENE